MLIFRFFFAEEGSGCGLGPRCIRIESGMDLYAGCKRVSDERFAMGAVGFKVGISSLVDGSVVFFLEAGIPEKRTWPSDLRISHSPLDKLKVAAIDGLLNRITDPSWVI